MRSQNRRRRILGLLIACGAVAGFCDQVRGQSITTGDLQLELSLVFDGVGLPFSDLSAPTGIVTNGDGSGDLYLNELGGAQGGATRIRRIASDGSLSTFLDISSQIPNIHPLGSGPLGLISIAFHPDYNDPAAVGYRRLYTYHTETTPTEPVVIDFEALPNLGVHHHNVLTEWRVDANDPTVVDVDSRREVLRTEHIGFNHVGGALDFDDDGNLFLAIGTSGGGSPVVQLNAQLTNTVEGSLLRIDPIDPALTPGSPNAAGANGRFRVPADNPFVSGGAAPEVYAYGVRSPYRGSFDPQSGLFFLGDVGEGSFEEVSAIAAGDNLGWPYREGDNPGVLARPPTVPLESLTAPITEYRRGDGRAVVGGFVYRGSIPELQGKYVFGEFSFGAGDFNSSPGRLFWTDPFDPGGGLRSIDENQIFEFTLSAETCETIGAEPCAFDSTLYSFGEGDDGEIYILGTVAGSSSTRVYQITGANLLDPGDFNGDGLVDAADYTVWRDTLGATGIRLPADANNDLVVDTADYLLWRESFSAANAAPALQVPESSSLVLICLSVIQLSYSLRIPGRRHSERLS